MANVSFECELQRHSKSYGRIVTDPLLTDGRSEVIAVADKSTLARDRPSFPIPHCRPAAPK